MFEEMAVHGVLSSCRISAACFPQRGATDGGASEHPGPTVDRLMALESPDLLHDTAVPPSIAIFIRGGEKNS
jgi:hypothetical protein